MARDDCGRFAAGTDVPFPHGTYSGAQRHRKEGETPCDPCKAAAAEYQRAWRQSAPHDRVRTSARTKALWRLAALHHDEYMALYAEEARLALRASGLDQERRSA